MQILTQPKLLIANRGEIAIRIARAAKELGIPSVGIYSEDDANSLHHRKMDTAIALTGRGPLAYLDQKQIIQIAKQEQCTLVHPGYGFLSENATFAQHCSENALHFIGPSPSTLTKLGDKAQAKVLAIQEKVPVLTGINQAISLEDAVEFFKSLPTGKAMLLKAIAGGGGRGMRIINKLEAINEAFDRCSSEAQKAFGNSALYAEQFIPKARHIEVQVIGDGQEVVILGERECSLQRQHQKLIEIAPCPNLAEPLREKIHQAARSMAKAVAYQSAGTFEFLVEGTALNAAASFYFIEANPRIQVEHTVTEELFNIDIVQFQIQQALGHSLKDLGIVQETFRSSEGFAIQTRINAEQIDATGRPILQIGAIKTYDLPTGKGIRLDSSIYAGFKSNPNFDSLLLKVICRSGGADFSKAVEKAYQALKETRIEGLSTNIEFLKNVLQHAEVQQGHFYTRFIKDHLSTLLKPQVHKAYYFEKEQASSSSVLKKEHNIPEGYVALSSPMPGSILKILVQTGEPIQKGQTLLILEAMKMESVIKAHATGIVHEIIVEEGAIVADHQTLIVIKPVAETTVGQEKTETIDLNHIRPDLAELKSRQAFLQDENRPEAIAKRRKYGQFTARENVAALCDEGSFVEYGGLSIAAQRYRRTMEDLIQNTPADGLVTGLGNINGAYFEAEKARCLIMAYDYTVLAGTQGAMNHKKMDRMLHLAEDWEIPIIIFAEGGGGRPGDVDVQTVAGLDVPTFTMFARMSGKVPRISIVSRYCFAGNAALAGCADVIIATENSSIGMGGPAMIEGGGLGKFHPKDVGPVSFQGKNGVIDLVVKDEMQAVAVAKQYLSYFQGNLKEWESADQRILRRLIPENRRRVYDIRKVIETLADRNSVLELRKDFGIGMITAFIRVEGRPIGLIANNPMHLGGAIDSDGADKAARFMQLCNAFNIPIISLCDTPGIMVGPEAEKTGTVRHAARLFVIGGSLQVPYIMIVLRKGYGLGAQAMAGGSFKVPVAAVTWPTGEFGAMGLEGAVKLGFRKELEQAGSPEEQQALFDQMVAKAYERGKGLHMATFYEIDDVIDPADSRKWIISGLDASMNKGTNPGNPRFVDTW